MFFPVKVYAVVRVSIAVMKHNDQKLKRKGLNRLTPSQHRSSFKEIRTETNRGGI